MARLWQLGVQEVRPGTYFRTSSGDVTTEGAINGIVAIAYQSNWGAINTVVDISPEDMNNLRNIVGTGSGYEAIRQAFIGGALMVRAVRVGVEGQGKTARKVVYSSKVKAYKTKDDGTLDLDASGKAQFKITDAPAFKIYAKYPGTREFKASVFTNPVNKKRQLSIYEGNYLVESFTVAAGEKESIKFVNAINSESKYFTAKHLLKQVVTNATTGKDELTTKDLGTRVSDFAQKSFGSGANPYPAGETSYGAGVYSTALEALERYNWNVVIADTNSASVHSMLNEFVIQSYETGRFGIAVIGGQSSKLLFSTSDEVGRVDYATALNDWRTVYVLGGWFGTDGKKYDGYKAAARIAGMVAGCESNASITHLVISGAFRPLDNLTNGEMIQAEEGGCVVLSPNEEGQVWVDNANTTLVTLGNDQDEGWKKIRRTKCRFELMSRVNRTCDKLIGRLNNDAHGRATIVTAMTTVIREMIAEHKLFDGSYAEEDSRYKPEGDHAYFVLHIGDIDSLEKIYLDYTFSYANPFSELDVVTT
ncbi:MAG: phage tail sheath subtilisin-like domain-containing protein [Selenomonadaceae bacterium]|nr:phage tail sheath subtilisin-like domain-containing protein [Clostridia bacterium]MBR3497792.1 phage tail sheath subtilisin-like domain-containing protein [Selenomonadaceae bacterium]